jgi:hypothetical protein
MALKVKQDFINIPYRDIGAGQFTTERVISVNGNTVIVHSSNLENGNIKCEITNRIKNEVCFIIPCTDVLDGYRFSSIILV